MTTIAPTSMPLSTMAISTMPLSTPVPTTPPPHNPDLDVFFNCRANNFAGILIMDMSISGLSLNATYIMADLELSMDMAISGSVPCSGLYYMDDLELSMDMEIDGWGVTNEQKKNWVGWSKIGDVSFELDMVNDAGFRPMSWSGYVYQTIQLDKSVVVYGSGGVTISYPVADPMATFGFSELPIKGIKNKTAACGDRFVHYCIDTLGCLWRIKPSGLDKLGYEEFLLPMTNPTMSWDTADQRLYISDDTEGYILNEDVLTGGYIKLTGLYRVASSLKGVSPETIEADAVHICTDIIDFERRGMKSIESVQFDAISDVKLYAAIDYRYRKVDSFKTTPWTPLNHQGVAHCRTACVDCRIRLKGEDHGTFDLSYISIQFKFIDQRFTRDPKGPMNVY